MLALLTLPCSLALLRLLPSPALLPLEACLQRVIPALSVSHLGGGGAPTHLVRVLCK